jgi:hypothetical protein
MSIKLATFIYQLFLAAALALSLMLAAGVALILNPSFSNGNLSRALIIAALCYVASDIYGYLSGNLVSEVPALLFVGAATVSLVKAIERGSLVCAVASGVFAFLLYLSRVESLWAYVTFVAVMYVFLRRRFQGLECLFIIGVALATLAALYGAYLWLFYPLPNPWLFWIFAKSQQDIHQGVPAIRLVFAAGGVLWIGVFIGLLHMRISPVIRFSLMWLLLQSAPYLVGIVQGMPAQTRMFSLLMPGLLIASSQGWLVLLNGFHRSISQRFCLLSILAAGGLMLIISNSVLYPHLRSLPGLWRLDYVRTFLVPPRYEKLTYPLNELAEISRLVYSPGQSILLVRDPAVPQEYLNVVRYLGAKYAPESDLALIGDPTNGGDCSKKAVKRKSEPVIYCTELDVMNLPSVEGRRSLFLERNDLNNSGSNFVSSSTVLQTKTLTIRE